MNVVIKLDSSNNILIFTVVSCNCNWLKIVVELVVKGFMMSIGRVQLYINN